MKTKRELNRDIKRLEAELQEEMGTNGSITKKAIFLKSAINVYLKKLGKPAKYSW